jgi:hypothetical protein
MRNPKPYLSIVLLITFFFLPYSSFAKEKLAVMDLKAKYGVADGLAEALSVEVRNAIHSQGEYEVLSKEDLETIAERTRMRQSLGCDDTQCLIDFGQAIGTKYMIAGSISKLGDTYSVDLRLIDTEGDDTGVKNRASRKCTCSEDQLFGTAVDAATLVMGKEVSEKGRASQTVKETVLPGSSQADISNVSGIWEDGALKIVVDDVVKTDRCLVIMIEFANMSKGPLLIDVNEYKCYLSDEIGERWRYRQHEDTAALWQGKMLSPGYYVRSKMSFCSRSSSNPQGELLLFIESQSDYGGRYPFVAVVKGIQLGKNLQDPAAMSAQEQGESVVTNPKPQPPQQSPCFIETASWL